LQDLEDIYELRIVLEGLASRLAAQRTTSSDIAYLGHLLQQMEMATDAGKIDIPTFLNAQFHQAIAEATRNKYLIELISRFHNSVQRLKYTTLAYPGRAQQALEEHRRLLEAIKRRDPKAAEQIAQEHIKRAKEIRIKIYHRKSMQEALSSRQVAGGENNLKLKSSKQGGDK
jgi:DNA-binding GntR family transcriptional regulator